MGQYILLSVLISIFGVVALFIVASAFNDLAGSIGIVLIIFLSIIVTLLLRIVELLKEK
jgi:hypothetical protein